MHLRAVELRDWRSYRHARFEFPIPSGKSNVILVRAPNEHGKTSFFEAICARRPNFDHPCRLNSDQGWKAAS